MLRIGLVSDTHGLLRPEVAEFLRGCDHIVHGGDVCDRSVVSALEALAPVTAVRGNNDRGAWAEGLRESEWIRFDDVLIYAIHDLAQIDVDPAAAGVRVVVSGHSHRPLIDERGGVLFVNRQRRTTPLQPADFGGGVAGRRRSGVGPHGRVLTLR